MQSRELRRYATIYPPTPSDTLSRSIIDCTLQISLRGMFPPRAVTPTVPVDLPVLMANYAQPMIAWRMLDVIESHAELLPIDRGDWVEFFTNRFMGEDRSPGAYAMTRISVGAALPCGSYKDRQLPLDVTWGRVTHSLHASQLFTTITPEDLTVTSIMCRQDTVDFLCRARGSGEDTHRGAGVFG